MAACLLPAATAPAAILINEFAYDDTGAADDREFARLLGHATGGTIELCHATSEAAWLSAIPSARLLVSGRFHYSIAAAWLGTPFIALDSNTPKMDGLMQTLGLGFGCAEGRLIEEREGLCLADARRWRRWGWWRIVATWTA